jgi:hypothetical protein
MRLKLNQEGNEALKQRKSARNTNIGTPMSTISNNQDDLMMNHIQDLNVLQYKDA